MKKRISKSIAVLMCLLTAVAFMPVISFGTDEAEAGDAPAQELTQQDADDEAAAAEEETEAASAMETTGSGATEGTAPTPADPIDVNITVSNQGVLAKAKDGSAMAYREVHVTDVDEDGHITYEEALIAAQDKYLEGGAKSNYSASSGWVTKFWGVKSDASFSFVRNNKIDTDESTGYSSTVDSLDIADGDSLTASVNSDSTYYADWYTYFNEKNAAVEQDEELTLNLKGFQAMAGSGETVVPGVKVGIWKDGKFQQTGDAVTDNDGNVKISFSEPGEYLVTASGTVKDEVTDWSTMTQKEVDCPIMAPACIVKVYAKPAKVQFTINNEGTIASDSEGNAIAYRDVTVTDVDKNGKLTYDEALTAVHEEYCPDGYTTSGSWVTKFWGSTTGNFSFLLNNGLTDTVDQTVIKAGDSLYASVNADNTNYADWYTYFNKSSRTVCPNEQFTLSLKGFQAMSGGDAKAVEGVKLGVWENGSCRTIEGAVTDKDGFARLSLDEAGTYIVTAIGAVNDTWTDWSGNSVTADCPIMAPVCVVTVEGDTAGLIGSLKDTIATLKAAAIAPAPKASATGTTSIRLTWTVSEGVDGYELSRDGGKTWTAVTGSSRSFTGLSPATKYSYQVRGYVYLDGEGTDKYYSKAASASATTKLGTVSGVSVKSKSRKLTTKWSKVTGASSYQVYISTSSKFNKGLVKYTTKSLSKTSKKLKKGKKYYVKVRAYKNGVYGSWSSVKKVKCK